MAFRCCASERSTRWMPAAGAWILLLGTTALFFSFPIPYLVTNYGMLIALFESLFTIFVISTLVMSTFMDPGRYPKEKLDNDDDLDYPLARNVNIKGIPIIMKWCATCHIYRPPRSAHCNICNCCIEMFDHHCPWVNNCIGRCNYRYFCLLLFSLTSHILSLCALCSIYVWDHRQELGTVHNIISMCLAVIASLVFVPIFGLACFHIMIISRGRTTNEQVTGKIKDGLNPFTDGCLVNFSYAFCGPTWPMLLRRNRLQPDRDTNNMTVPHESRDNEMEIFHTASSTSDGENVNHTTYNLLNSGTEYIEAAPPSYHSNIHGNLASVNFAESRRDKKMSTLQSNLLYSNKSQNLARLPPDYYSHSNFNSPTNRNIVEDRPGHRNTKLLSAAHINLQRSRTDNDVTISRNNLQAAPPPSPQIVGSICYPIASSAELGVQGISNIPGAVRRPNSFVKALELVDRVAPHDRPRSKLLRRQTNKGLMHEILREEEDERGYMSNYGIAV